MWWRMMAGRLWKGVTILLVFLQFIWIDIYYAIFLSVGWKKKFNRLIIFFFWTYCFYSCYLGSSVHMNTSDKEQHQMDWIPHSTHCTFAFKLLLVAIRSYWSEEWSNHGMSRLCLITCFDCLLKLRSHSPGNHQLGMLDKIRWGVLGGNKKIGRHNCYEVFMIGHFLHYHNS
jgi:hypothetical protein